MKNSLIEFSKEEKKVIMDMYFPKGTTPQEMQFNMAVAQKLGLDPITKEIYFIERTSSVQVNGRWEKIRKIEPLVGRDAFLKIAHRSGNLKGMETAVAIENTPKLVNGKWVLEEELVATCIIYKKDSDMPTSVEVNYSEYVQRKSSGEITKFWKEKPITMLKKVAESQALRKAFNISGVYSEDEISNNHETITVTPEPTDTNMNDIGSLIKKPKDVVEVVDEVTGEITDDTQDVTDLLEDVEVEVASEPEKTARQLKAEQDALADLMGVEDGTD